MEVADLAILYSLNQFVVVTIFQEVDLLTLELRTCSSNMSPYFWPE